MKLNIGCLKCLTEKTSSEVRKWINSLPSWTMHVRSHNRGSGKLICVTYVRIQGDWTGQACTGLQRMAITVWSRKKFTSWHTTCIHRTNGSWRNYSIQLEPGFSFRGPWTPGGPWKYSRVSVEKTDKHIVMQANFLDKSLTKKKLTHIAVSGPCIGRMSEMAELIFWSGCIKKNSLGKFNSSANISSVMKTLLLSELKSFNIFCWA